MTKCLNGAFDAGDYITDKETGNKYKIFATLHGGNYFKGGVGLRLEPKHPLEIISVEHSCGGTNKWADSIHFIDKWDSERVQNG